MVTSEEINPFIKNAWPGSIYRLALPVSAPRFDLSAMEKLLANLKPCHVICFCKFVEIIHNPIMWPKGQSCIKNIQSLCYHGGGQLSYGKAWRLLPIVLDSVVLLRRGTFPSRFTKPLRSFTRPFFMLQTRNNCDITDLGPGVAARWLMYCA